MTKQKENPKFRPVALKLRPETFKYVEEAAWRKRIPMGVLVRRIVESHFEREGLPPMPKSFVEE
jgi:hypothetical protein